MHGQTDRKTDRQKQTDHNNPPLSSSVNDRTSHNYKKKKYIYIYIKKNNINNKIKNIKKTENTFGVSH